MLKVFEHIGNKTFHIAIVNWSDLMHLVYLPFLEA